MGDGLQAQVKGKGFSLNFRPNKWEAQVNNNKNIWLPFMGRIFWRPKARRRNNFTLNFGPKTWGNRETPVKTKNNILPTMGIKIPPLPSSPFSPLLPLFLLMFFSRLPSSLYTLLFFCVLFFFLFLSSHSSCPSSLFFPSPPTLHILLPRVSNFWVSCWKPTWNGIPWGPKKKNMLTYLPFSKHWNKLKDVISDSCRFRMYHSL